MSTLLSKLFGGRKHDSEPIIRSAAVMTAKLFNESLDKFLSWRGVSFDDLDSCVRKIAEAQMMVVAHSASLSDMCVMKSCYDFDAVDRLGALTGNAAHPFGVQLTHDERRSVLRTVWRRFDPITQMNLDYRYRLFFVAGVQTDEERAVFEIMQRHSICHLQYQFSLDHPYDTEWLEFIADLAAGDFDQAIRRLEVWRDVDQVV